MINDKKIGVVIPCFKVEKHILNVISQFDDSVDKIYVVDDCCPNESGNLVAANCGDKRVTILRNMKNLGVGGAVIRGYLAALEDHIDVIVKIDGDGQMDPSILSSFVKPITKYEADYTKGNRFYNLEQILVMPKKRIFGNAVLSFITKFSSGYWNIFDPTNGYTAISTNVIRLLPLQKINNGYFFETDMLFRLNTIRAVVKDVPMNAVYLDEQSNLKIHKILLPFLLNNIRNFFKRIFYNYYLRDLSISSIELPIGFALIFFGGLFGLYKWIEASNLAIPATAGSVMISALPILMGLQLILAFFNNDIASTPTSVINKKLSQE
jgi:dolichol-phosphate mannosyltransferase